MKISAVPFVIFVQNSYGFKTNGGSEYVDLGNWTGETCFTDPDSCELGEKILFKLNF